MIHQSMTSYAWSALTLPFTDISTFKFPANRYATRFALLRITLPSPFGSVKSTLKCMAVIQIRCG